MHEGLLGMLGDICLVTIFGKYLFIAIQHSVYKALKINTQYVFTSPKFTKFTKLINSKDKPISKFFQGKLTREV